LEINFYQVINRKSQQVVLALFFLSNFDDLNFEVFIKENDEVQAFIPFVS
jgi:hypothetical protein